MYISLIAGDELRHNYADSITASVKGIASTLLVGHVAAGHAHLKDTCLSSLHFGRTTQAQISTIGGVSTTRSEVFTDEETVGSSKDFPMKMVLEQQSEAKSENV
ncbi:uncharacterized protein EV420DRAFT_1647086 [Desarmillaria tabescens]|uniref:Uncharacterized protein n=1 Tax=Armillaria tabescens TaxID=1929756 RepID=A0AA39MWR7_ARMTA|nr:uncharacterized protein EV420DRAFT_1647086 [Desarmillaria tabescens]KAK0449058.1 hypothetical protein EV420DRAFT_1647086 [Desarmillaria tabescens]